MTADEITVEEALAQLREAFPDKWFSIEVVDKPIMGRYFFVRVHGCPKQTEASDSLSDCMAQVRAWKEEQ